jgi:hypothetical protein
VGRARGDRFAQREVDPVVDLLLDGIVVDGVGDLPSLLALGHADVGRVAVVDVRAEEVLGP